MSLYYLFFQKKGNNPTFATAHSQAVPKILAHKLITHNLEMKHKRQEEIKSKVYYYFFIYIWQKYPRRRPTTLCLPNG
jgi:hypothetical protein